MPDNLRPAPPEIIAVVDALIAEHFPQLRKARLIVLVQEQATDIGGGKVRVAAAGANNDRNAPFDYIVWFALDAWQVMNDGDREAIVYHELTHCGRDEAGRPELKEHDAGVFSKEVELYGVWWKDAQKRFKAARDAGERR